MTTLREVYTGFPRKGGGRYMAMDLAVHAREINMREMNKKDIRDAKESQEEVNR
jgi:hypothetical protein